MNITYIKLVSLALSLNGVMTSFVNAHEQSVNVTSLNDEQSITQQLMPQEVAIQESTVQLTIQEVSQAKRTLMAKLATLNHFSANFNQEVYSEAGDILEKSAGKLAISKPNLANWHTLEPDELEIVSDGENVWFYNPWIEQVSVYSLSAAIAQTPILLLTSQDETLWQNYRVTRKALTQEALEQEKTDINSEANNKDETFVITANDVNSQIKSLTLRFDATDMNGKLKQFSFLDATGQLSHIKLSDFDDHNSPKTSLFKFVVPQGVQIDDQRVN